MWYEESVPTVDVPGEWRDLLNSPARVALERDVLPQYVPTQRWFGGKSRALAAVRVADWGPLPVPAGDAFLAVLEVTFADGGRDSYFLPLAVGEPPADLPRPATIARVCGPCGEAALYDGLAADAVCRALLAVVGDGWEVPLRGGTVRGLPTAAFATLCGGPADVLVPAPGPATSSNSLVFFGDRLLMKAFRRVAEGTNPDYEVGRFLTERTDFHRIPRVAGAIVRAADGRTFSLGILQELVPNQGAGWEHALAEVGRFYDRVGGPAPAADDRPLLELAATDPPPAVADAIGGYLACAATLGRRTAEMHRALASDASDPAFAPEPLTAADGDALREETLAQARAALSALAANVARLPADVAGPAQGLLENAPAILDRLAAARGPVPAAAKTRVHGDYHLGQVLWTGGDYVILDFEGEPTRPVEERRGKFSPVRDVAGMLRSYHYAAYAGLFARTPDQPSEFDRLRPWADLWVRGVSAAFLRAYRQAAGGAAFLPSDPAAVAALLDGFTLAKALYELAYELNNRPDWVRIPLGGVLALLGTDGPRAPSR